MNITKRLTRDKTYIRPKTTYQDSMNNKEINQTIVENVLKLLERREKIDSWKTEYKKLNTDIDTTT